MAREKSDPARKPPGTTPTQMRLTAEDLAAADRIAAHFHLDSRTAAVRLALRHVAENLAPLTAPKKNRKKSEG